MAASDWLCIKNRKGKKIGSVVRKIQKMIQIYPKIYKIYKIYKVNTKYQAAAGPAQAKGRARAGGRLPLGILFLYCISLRTLDIFGNIFEV